MNWFCDRLSCRQHAHRACHSGSLLQGVFSEHWNCFVQLGRLHFSTRLETCLAIMRGRATARKWNAFQRRHGLAGSTLSIPAKMTCVCQRNRKAVWSSRCGKHPTTNSNRNRRIRRIHHSLCNPDNLCSLRNRGSRRNLGLPVPCPEAILCFPCRKHRTSPD